MCDPYLTRVVPGAEVANIDWLSATLRVERAIVRQRVGDVKTVYSGRLMSIDSGMLELLKSWRQTTQFSRDNDWVFASPVKLGRLPVSYPWVWKVFQRAGTQAGIGGNIDLFQSRGQRDHVPRLENPIYSASTYRLRCSCPSCSRWSYGELDWHRKTCVLYLLQFLWQ